MKTFADLKRDLKVGDAITMIYSSWGYNSHLNIKRYIVRKTSTLIEISPDKNAANGSRLAFECAARTEYDGTNIKIYQEGRRPLTDTEKFIFDHMPSKLPKNEVQCNIDMLTDGSVMFYKDKQYLANNKMEYLESFCRGPKRYDPNTNTIIDSQIKGELELHYVLERL